MNIIHAALAVVYLQLICNTNLMSPFLLTSFFFLSSYSCSFCSSSSLVTPSINVPEDIFAKSQDDKAADEDEGDIFSLKRTTSVSSAIPPQRSSIRRASRFGSNKYPSTNTVAQGIQPGGPAPEVVAIHDHVSIVASGICHVTYLW